MKTNYLQHKKRKNVIMIMIFIPMKQISKVNILTMRIAMTRLLSKRKRTLKRKTQEHLLPKSRRKNKKISWNI